MKLYEIDEQVFTLLNDGMVVDPETGEVLLDEDSLDGLLADREDTIEAVALYVKALDAEAAAIREEEKALVARRQVKERKAERLRRYIAGSMEAMGDEKLETARVALSFRRSTAVEITDERAVPDRFCTFKRAANKTAIKAAIKNGEQVEGAELVERRSLQLK